MPRSCHRKRNIEAGVAFKERLTQRLIALDLPRDRPVRLWIYDEMRYGLAPVTRRTRASRGIEIVAPVYERDQWGYGYGGLQAGGGGAEFLIAPRMSKEVDLIFLEQISQRDPWVTLVVIGDGAGFHHREKNTALPDNLHILGLPPYSPELNPVERLWDVVKDGICNTQFTILSKTLRKPLEKNCAIIGRTWRGSFRLWAAAGCPAA